MILKTTSTTMKRHTSSAAAICTAIVSLLLLATKVDALSFGIGGRGLQARPQPASSRLARSTTAAKSHVHVNSDNVGDSSAAIASIGELPSSIANSARWHRSKPFKKAVNVALHSLAISTALLTVVSPPAHAAAAAAKQVEEHLHTGQKIANYFRSFNLPDLAVLAIISALPVVELRGAVPVGVWMGLPLSQVLIVCVLGNMAPIVPLMFLLRNKSLKKLMAPILSRAEKKSASLGVGSIEKQWASLAAFVGIPLPGTGAWTGAMGAFLLGMPTAVALSSIFTGVVAAGCIMMAITLAGKKGGIGECASWRGSWP
eukprot:CCRYP_002094-RA/>CCRYP_002094-RA protein AED:0.10 eAED:0.10 QI:15/1/1/1/1/1/4/434/314